MNMVLNKKIAVVAPCHIPPTKEWIEALDRESQKFMADVIIVDDSNGKLGELPAHWQVFNYHRQEEFLEELYPDFHHMFHKCSACRVFGHLWAYTQGYQTIIGLDSDCVVREDFIKMHILPTEFLKGFGWSNPIRLPGWYSRGFPYFMRDWPIVGNMGLWSKTLDLNGKDRSESEPKEINASGWEIASAPIPYSGMNFALKREALAGFLFLPNFNHLSQSDGGAKEFKFRRIDDIWGGYIFQKLAQKRRESISYGAPVVDHISEVIAAEDAADEEAMYYWEELFITQVDRAMSQMGRFSKSPYWALFESFLVKFKELESKGVFENIIPAMEWWVKAWKKYGQ